MKIHLSNHAQIRIKSRNISARLLKKIINQLNFVTHPKCMIIVSAKKLKQLYSLPSNTEALIILIAKKCVITAFYSHDLDYTFKTKSIKDLPIVHF